jgi:prefoldin beta subunit
MTDPQAIQKEFLDLGQEIQKLANDRQQLMIKLNENEGVRSELVMLSSDAELFRAVGSALIKTESNDAKALIDGRIDMIKKDLTKIEQLVEEKVRSPSSNKRWDIS